MKVTVPAEFTLSLNYDEAYLLHDALRQADSEGWSPSGKASAQAMVRQLAGLLSLASGADVDSLPFLCTTPHSAEEVED